MFFAIKEIKCHSSIEGKIVYTQFIPTRTSAVTNMKEMRKAKGGICAERL
jgi:hypothetical protein